MVSSLLFFFYVFLFYSLSILKFVDCLFVFVEARGGSCQYSKKVTFRSHSSKSRSQGHRRCTVKITLRMWSRHNQRN